MNNKKPTKREMFTKILATLTDEAEIAFIKHEIELLDKKNASNSAPKEFVLSPLHETILAAMEDGVQYTVSAVMKLDSALSELTIQKVTAALRQLLDHGYVKRVEEKRTAFFIKA